VVTGLAVIGLVVIGAWLMAGPEREDDPPPPTEPGKSPTVPPPLPPLPPKTVSLRVETDPSKAEVYVDATRRGISPLNIEGLDSGRRYEVTVRKTGCDDWRKDITALPLMPPLQAVLECGKPREREEVSEGPQRLSNLQVITEPAGATIELNGNQYGRTPRTVTDIRGEKVHLRLTLEGFATYEKELTLRAKGLTKVRVDLMRDEAPPPLTPTEAGASVAGGSAQPSKGPGEAVPKLPVGNTTTKDEDYYLRLLREEVSRQESARRREQEETEAPAKQDKTGELTAEDEYYLRLLRDQLAREESMVDQKGLSWTIRVCRASGNWEQAQQCCQGLSLGGFTDWRLPSSAELAYIYDSSRPGCKVLAPIELRNCCVWSADWRRTQGSRLFCFVDPDPQIGFVSRESQAEVLCVRPFGW
jgi:hypothetical protein